MTLLVLLLPLFSCLFCLLFGYKIGRIGSIYISISNMVITTILALIIFYKVALLHTVITLSLFSWLTNEFFLLKWTFLFDSLSVTMLIVVTIVSCVVHIYSTSYMSEDPQLPRFLAYLSLFTFFMLILITSNNFLQLFMGWEGVGLCSYLLISFWYTRISAGKAAMKAIVLNRVGDCGLLLAIFLIFLTFRSLEFSVIWTLVPFFTQHTFLFLNYEFNILSLIACFLLVAAIGKSAQLGLHTWLPDAMEGPTPVSALIHAATMVTAGVFLIIRCSAIFEYSPNILLLMALIGSLTSIFAATAAIVQHDIKKTIAYSTCSQLGYMVFCCALSNYPTGLYHLVTHAFFKALLFLSAGAVIHALANEQDIRKMGGLVKLLPFTYVMMLIGSLALGGFPFLAGFYSKDLILETTLQTINYFQYFVIITSFVTALLTAIYSFRTLYLIFLAPISVYKSTSKKIHDVPKVMALSLFILSIGSIFSGYYFFDMFAGLGSDFLENSIFVRNSHATIWIAIEYLNPFLKQIAPCCGIVGIIIAFYFLKEYGFFLTLYKSIYHYSLYKFLINKWYFDNVYSNFSKQLFNFNYYNFYKLLDKGIFEFLGPRGSVLLISRISDIFVRTQTGYIWHYMSLMSFFLLIMAFLFIDVDLKSLNILTYAGLGIISINKKQNIILYKFRNKKYFSTHSYQPRDEKKFSPLPPIEPDTVKLMSISFVCWLLAAILIQVKKVWLFGYFLWAGIFFNFIYYCLFVNRVRWCNYIEYVTTLDLHISSKWESLHKYLILLSFTLRLVVIHLFFNTWGGRLVQQLMALFVFTTILLVPPVQYEWSMLALISLECSIWGTLFFTYFTILSKKKLILSYMPDEIINSLVKIPSIKKQDNKQNTKIHNIILMGGVGSKMGPALGEPIIKEGISKGVSSAAETEASKGVAAGIDAVMSKTTLTTNNIEIPKAVSTSIDVAKETFKQAEINDAAGAVIKDTLKTVGEKAARDLAAPILVAGSTVIGGFLQGYGTIQAAEITAASQERVAEENRKSAENVAEINKQTAEIERQKAEFAYKTALVNRGVLNEMPESQQSKTTNSSCEIM